MLLTYGTKNFCCFKDWIEIDLRLNSKVPNDIYKVDSCSTIICIKGANSSGKTNALKALTFLASFTNNSFTDYKPDDKIKFDSYFNNSEVTEFYIDFRYNKIEFQYIIIKI